ncbi:hypothetical protein CcaverHIS002_0400560 [Cutaneotrichosporon cavernicola]|uniref:BTB domain-containing protein n=1 Tax=Cutaneotrichosporon cavernicola TaxID=279322 RepID=A0AA48QVE5_9TREE|nr:uncharacterized protein CcaverHIS019_0400530 [Cutaneotrichosporon cavernicola]BEI83452.1 hypothetical protein CcaverHIS002_0400560 [Cutaneotrichosporon cavernicola]BEI91233.1 hypothetical protein CcaverHIS019_0400530 [Cutaneotrichosporon cavernicola]BEI99006.1 hypothetical protein CcaverHIS631_0400490 [Cutaneotrichosporon cavernicola]BEJ06780.1 hypothetical protein CcaverHIS641_0400490 [Cutaneotrichosporon cavernicola]
MSATGTASPAPSAAPISPPANSKTSFASSLQEYIFNTGFCGQQYADIQVVFFNTSLKLHRLILARSPYLAHLILSLMPGSTLQLAFTDGNITEEAVYIALQHLYSPAPEHVNEGNARAVLAAAHLFGEADLADVAYAAVASAISAANVGEYIQWVGISPAANGNGFAFGSTGYDGEYGNYSARLRQDVLDFLLRSLPDHIKAAPEGTLATDPRLLAAYVPLPFDLFKQCVESPDLPIPFMQDRFSFAKRAITARKKAGGAGQFEESAVLALKDDGDGMAVHITRRPKRSRAALWKVEG